jgi:hypothetical protein
MTTDGSEYLVRCYAYNKTGQRCEQLAGHDGNHGLLIEWTDEECWTPGTPAPVSHRGTAKRKPEPVDGEEEILVEVDMTPPCESCKHDKAMHLGGKGECAGCDCKGYIG